MSKSKNSNTKQKQSGGIVASNLMQGSRAEIIAQYFFSEYCIAERVLKENDFGIDLYCSLMRKQGIMGYTSKLFGVQIKSGKEPFIYTGEYISQWLKMINIPLLMCRVNRNTFTIEIYSTWAIHNILSNNDSFNEVNFIESYSSDSIADELKMPEIDNDIAKIWMGPPIIKCSFEDIINKVYPIGEIENILEEWISFECLNYAKRHMGITTFFGYTKWNTNQSLNSSQRTWLKPHHYNIEQSKSAIHRILEALALVALNQGKDYEFVKSIAEQIKTNKIVDIKDLDSWHKGVIGIEEV